MNIYYYHVDMMHDSYNAMKSQVAVEFSKHYSSVHELSVVENLAGTEAIIKSAVDDSTWTPDWDNDPFVLHKYTKADHHQIIVDIPYTGPLWQEPPFGRQGSDD